ncbi:MAG TPA: hypothetical protein VFK97_00420, partial [Candidatus Saccharimonadales bacterium]|nr:hypothetical protein [Candidatus Saccharimonadales bacterium]
MKPVEWILFDVGGVLLDWKSSAASLALQLGVSADDLLSALFTEAPAMSTGKISAQEGWKKILDALGSNADPYKMVLQWRAKQFWFDDSLALVDQLSDAGYRLALFSNSWLGLSDSSQREGFPPQINKFGVIFDSSKDGLVKPDVSYYDLIQSELG